MSLSSLANDARRLSSKGRHGDTALLHLNEGELATLEASGKLTINPETGLPEAFNLGHWISQAAKNNPDPLNPSSTAKQRAILGMIRNPTESRISNTWGSPTEHNVDIASLGPFASSNPALRALGRNAGIAAGAYGAGALAGGVGESAGAGAGVGEGSASTAATGVAPAATQGVVSGGIGGSNSGIMAGLGGGGTGGAIGTGALEGGGVSNVIAGPGSTIVGDSVAGTGAGTAMSRILDGTATTADWLSAAGNIGSTALGIAGSRNAANAYRDLQNQYMAFGAPSRGRYEASMTPGFDPTNIPGYSGAVDTASKGILARLAATGGNPWGNPGGLIEANRQIISGTALPAIQQYQNQNAATGGFNAFNTAAPTAANAGIGANAGIYNAIGSGLAGLTNPQPSIYDTLARLGVQGLS